MKQQIPPSALIAAGVVALLILVFIGWRVMSSGGDTVDTKTIDARIAAKQAKGN